MRARVLGTFAISALGLSACAFAIDFDQFTKGSTAIAPGGGDGGGTTTSGEAGAAAQREGGANEGGVVVTCDATKTADDPKNCGACGHDCLGGACKTGKCQPVLVVDGIQNPNGVAVTSAGVYIGGDDGLFLLASGETRAKKIPGPSAPQFLVSTATDVFFADYDNGAITKVAIGTQELVTIKSGIARVEGIAVSPAFIYITRDQAKTVERLPFSTTPSSATLETLTSGYSEPNGIDWANGVVYVARIGPNDVVAVDESTGSFASPRVVMKGCLPYGVKVDGPDAFVTCTDPGSLVRVKIDGQSPPETLAKDLKDPAGLAITPTAIYWAEEVSGRVQMLAR